MMYLDMTHTDKRDKYVKDVVLQRGATKVPYTLHQKIKLYKKHTTKHNIHNEHKQPICGCNKSILWHYVDINP